jgi:hypothetical protein
LCKLFGRDRHVAAPDQDPTGYTFEIDKIRKDADFRRGQAENIGVGFELPAKLKPEVQWLSLVAPYEPERLPNLLNCP